MDTIEALIGSNNPPPDLLTGEALRERLRDDNVALLRRRDELLSAAGRIPAIDCDDVASRVSDFIKQLAALAKAADGKRVAAKEPFLEGGRTVDGFFKAITDPVDKAKKAVEARLTAYLREKEAERRRRAEAKPAEFSRTRGEYGAVASLRTQWTFDGLDRATLDLEALREHLPIDALEKAVRSFIKDGGRELRGVRIYECTTATVR